MLTIDRHKNVTLTRGDSCQIAVPLTKADGATYELADEDTLALTVKRFTSDAAALISKTMDETGTFVFEPSDTKGLRYGTYRYDVQLTTAAGEVFTVVKPRNFIIDEEVTD